MSDFRQKLVALGKGEASIADVASALDDMVVDSPESVTQAQKLLDAALKAGMPASVYADLRAHLPAPGDATVFRESTDIGDAADVAYEMDATQVPVGDATEMSGSDAIGDATIMPADGDDATMVRGADDADGDRTVMDDLDDNDATRFRGADAEEPDDATVFRGNADDESAQDVTQPDAADNTLMGAEDDATLFSGNAADAPDLDDATMMSGRGAATSAAGLDDDATVLHRRESGDITDTSAAGPADDATLVNQDSDRTLFSGDAIDEAFDILSPESMSAAEDSLSESSWPDHAPLQGAVLEFKEGSVLRNRFILETKLGEGGMGAVWKGVDKLKQEARDRNPYVAIKLLQGDFREHPEAFIALQRETSKQQRLAHPNIATVYDFDRDDATSTVFMTMEVLNGNDLAAFIRREVPKDGLEYEEAMPLIRQLAAGLAHAHSHELVHSDLKPGNCFVTDEGQLKLLDFGIARASKTKSDAEGETTVFDPGQLGALTPAYATIEMFEGQDPDPRDDIYAMAIIAYQLFTGKHPYGKKNAPKAQEAGLTVPPIAKLTKAQNRALEKGLAFKRDDRTGTVEELLEGLEPKRSQTWLWASAAGVILALGIAVGWPIVDGMIKESEREAIIARIVSPDTMQVALAAAGQLPDAEQRRLILLDDSDPRARDAAASLLTTQNENSVQQGLKLVKSVGEDFESALMVRDDVRDAIVKLYTNRSATFFSPAAEKYNFGAAQDEAKKLTRIYPDSASAVSVGTALRNQQSEFLDTLVQRFNSLVDAGAILKDPNADDVFDVRAIVKQVDPSDSRGILANDQLPLKAVAMVTAAVDEGDYQLADQMLKASLDYAPDDSDLADLRFQVESELQRQRNEVLVAEIEERLRGQDASFTNLAAFQAVRDDLIRLADLAPESEVLQDLQGRLTDAFDSALGTNIKNKSWAEAETLLVDFSKLFPLDYLESQRTRLTQAESSAGFALEMTDERQKAVDARRQSLAALLKDPKFDSEWEIALQVPFKEMIALLPAGHTAMEPVRRQIAERYVERSEEARANKLTSQATALLERGETFYRGFDGFTRQRALIAETNAEIAAERAEKARIARIDRALETVITQSRENQTGAASEALQALERDAVAGDEADTAKLTEARTALASAYGRLSELVANKEDWGQALKLLEQGLTLSPADNQLLGQKETYDTEYQKVKAVEELKSLLSGNEPVKRSELQRQLTQVKKDFPDKYEAKYRGEFARLAAARFQALPVQSTRDLGVLSDELKTLAGAFGGNINATARKELDARIAARMNKLASDNQRAAAKTYQQRALALKLVPDNGNVAKAEIPVPDPRADEGMKLVKAGKLTAAASLLSAVRSEAPKALNLPRFQNEFRARESAANAEFAKYKRYADAGQTRRGKRFLDKARQYWSDNADWAKISTGPGVDKRGACSTRLAGLGARARATCWDKVGNSRGPTLVVVPKGGGVAKPFAIGKLEVSIADYNLYCRNGGSCSPLAGDGKLPATGISVAQAEAYTSWLSQTTGATYRLPTDAEWEHAATAGGKGAKSKNFNCTVIVSGQTLKGQTLRTAQAGRPNGWGLINYVGNAREWVRSGGDLVTRGGAHTDPMSRCKVTLRESHSGNADPVTGFRVVRELG